MGSDNPRIRSRSFEKSATSGLRCRKADRANPPDAQSQTLLAIALDCLPTKPSRPFSSRKGFPSSAPRRSPYEICPLCEHRIEVPTTALVYKLPKRLEASY